MQGHVKLLCDTVHVVSGEIVQGHILLLCDTVQWGLVQVRSGAGRVW